MSRATTSVGPAAANGTMILTGRSGYPGLCANAATAKRDPVQAASIRAITLLTLMDVPWLLSGVSIHVSFSRRRGDRWWRQARPRPRRHQPASQRQTDQWACRMQTLPGATECPGAAAIGSSAARSATTVPTDLGRHCDG